MPLMEYVCLEGGGYPPSPLMKYSIRQLYAAIFGPKNDLFCGKNSKKQFFFGKKCTIIWYIFTYCIICVYPEMKIKTVFSALKS